jgi:hypothetical protein
MLIEGATVFGAKVFPARLPALPRQLPW